MYEFIDRLINIALPRIRDFRGLSANGFDQFGNYTLGIKEHIIFPEVNFDRVDKIRGLDITIVISSINKDGNDNVKPLIDGIDLIFKDFLKTLEKFDIKKIDCLGKKFDPNFHQAVSEEVNNDKEVDEIIKVIQDGYLIKDRLLRPASVVVIAKKDENKKK